ncbi:MAG: hypothetical protein MHM6MM_002356 [Cercozoa sp. M6MM]
MLSWQRFVREMRNESDEINGRLQDVRQRLIALRRRNFDAFLASQKVCVSLPNLNEDGELTGECRIVEGNTRQEVLQQLQLAKTREDEADMQQALYENKRAISDEHGNVIRMQEYDMAMIQLKKRAIKRLRAVLTGRTVSCEDSEDDGSDGGSDSESEIEHSSEDTDGSSTDGSSTDTDPYEF